MFGNYTPQPLGPGRNGFRALAVFDDNADGRRRAGRSLHLPPALAGREPRGVSQPEELHALPDLNVARIHLDYKESKRTDAFGNQSRYRAKVDDAQGTKVNRWAWDVFLVLGQ